MSESTPHEQILVKETLDLADNVIREVIQPMSDGIIYNDLYNVYNPDFLSKALGFALIKKHGAKIPPKYESIIRSALCFCIIYKSKFSPREKYCIIFHLCMPLIFEKDIHPSIYYHLAKVYRTGEYVEQNLDIAVYYYEYAITKGCTISHANLGIHYDRGWGVGVNHEHAFELYQTGADLGDRVCMHNLALCYFNGEGVDQNSQLAVYWIKKAMKLNYRKAFYEFGHWCANGTMVPQNLAKAKKYYKKARDLGISSAVLALARIKASG